MPHSQADLAMRNDLKPWVTKALLAGRKPLPDAGPKYKDKDKDKEKEGQKYYKTKIEAIPQKQGKVETPDIKCARTPRVPWEAAQIQDLLRLRTKGLRWEAIQVHFPDRTIEGIKQTFWKHRAILRGEPKRKRKRLNTSS